MENFHCFIKPAVKNSHDSGRPKNGMFISVPLELRDITKDVSPNHWRVQAIVITVQNKRILIINSYFPVDKRTINLDDNDALETLEAINSTIDDNEFDTLVWTGDINADFSRNSGHVRAVDNYVSENNLIKAWNKFEVDFTCTHETNGMTSISTIDHFFYNDAGNDVVEDAGVINLLDNTSDHCPIYCIVNFDLIPVKKQKETSCPKKPCWKRAKSEERNNFVNVLKNKLSNLETPQCVDCVDVHCKDLTHIDNIDDYAGNIFEILEVTAKDSLPTKGGPKRRKDTTHRNIPGWTESVKPFKDSAMFWHSIWLSMGKPINNQLHYVMKHSRNKYHYEVRKCKNAEAKIKKNKLLDACFNGEGDLFEEIKKLKKTDETIANSIDGVYDNIPEHFSSIYSNLYSSVDDHDEVLEIQKDINAKVNFSNLDDVRKITPDIVKEATENLKNSKSDPVFDFDSDCLKNAPDELFDHIAALMRMFLIHSHVSSYLLLATLVPIIKDKLGDSCSSKNYRSIAISSLILKIFDWIVIILFGVFLGLDDLQFAYQAKVSTTMCSWVVIETINYFMRNGSELYSCLCDMSKAFDLVKHSVLFRKLMMSGIPMIFLRLLLTIYLLQTANVRWNGLCSDFFPLTNGVKQGAILSAILYCYYMNGLFALLRERRAGCWVSGEYYGMVGYSDDNWLLAPSREALQEMLATCEMYAEEHNLIFSTDPNPVKCKTKCIAFLKKSREIAPLRLCGDPLPWVESGKHLGLFFKNKIDGMKHDIMVKRAKFIDRNNDIIQEFNFAHPKTKFKMNQIYNSHFSGSQVWDLFCHEATMLENTWNRSIRIMFDLPLQAHRYFICAISESSHVKSMLISRFISFTQKVESSTKKSVTHLFNVVRSDAQSITGSNLRNIRLLLDKDDDYKLSKSNANEVKYHPVDNENIWKVRFLQELIDVKHGELTVDLNHKEIQELIDHISTS